jgi:hypothetical protein
MNFPKLLVGAGVLFWGWQTSHPFIAVAMALLLEAPGYSRFRLEFSDTDYRRIADFSSALFAGVAVLLLVNQGTTRGVLSSLQWFPVVLAPLLLAQRAGAAGLIRTSALFHYARRQLRRDPSTRDPLVDLSGPYVALLIIAAGAANSSAPGYFPGVIALSAWGLFAVRPRGVPKFAFAALVVFAAGAGYAGQIGLSHLQAALEAWVDDFLIMLPNDPERTLTRIGSIGRIKQHDSVALRLYAPEKEGERLRLLHSASFNEYKQGAWIAREPQGRAPELTGTAAGTASIVLRVPGGRTLLPLPSGTLDIVGLTGLTPQRSGLGTVTTHTVGGWLRYEVGYADADAGYAPPGADDLALPQAERATLERIASDLKLKDSSSPVQTLERFFQGFSYSTWRESEVAAGMTGLEDFLLRAKSGHCEYFAAATTLLLRAAGIPARYATGFAAMEYSTLEGAWLVRARHAHAWTRAYVGGRWVDADLTPPSWVESEAELAPAWERLLDLARWAVFRWSTRSQEETSPLWWLAAAVLAVILAWRIVKQRRAVRLGSGSASAPRRYSGADSEFYALEKSLSVRYRPRAPHESLSAWFFEMKKQLRGEDEKQIRALLELHYRYRFDPRGLTPEERAALREGALAFST